MPPAAFRSNSYSQTIGLEANPDYLQTLNILQQDAPESPFRIGTGPKGLYLTISHAAAKLSVLRSDDSPCGVRVDRIFLAAISENNEFCAFISH
ncbi:hypothetical protein K4039_11870 [Lyngbya sp. CCAP 1446/10]|uniref:hypothetical protein n=1 Tax=Lyngbya sp. CCAP 1446/10 TaxID=439293 RepID=UPI0022386066|nr:hypothetical protein [Lyngbya sp. CCAP 1446/10]MCW6050766.1 hypothetical protein [Lyngbya sp. CCAP 1446/10]